MVMVVCLYVRWWYHTTIWYGTIVYSLVGVCTIPPHIQPVELPASERLTHRLLTLTPLPASF